jgi:hypothetical protein
MKPREPMYGEDIQVHWDTTHSWWAIHGEDSLLGYTRAPLMLENATFEVDGDMLADLQLGVEPQFPLAYITGTWVPPVALDSFISSVEYSTSLATKFGWPWWTQNMERLLSASTVVIAASPFPAIWTRGPRVTGPWRQQP